ncbi:hypothetical protein GSY74_04795 [Sulfurovum sp. bin170]|uniref:hypothetical protein n=1 Tax=Sulfurovum sp. bin170 TaxID=2695268 RepID=UPI0013DFDE64|nr:hypothetical protein [Sulfurovum sp. bin170]NEW60594.1 hypothetical protein [Sulfurovum sp. bin170]
MKSKFIFIIVLLSLFLNISHDILIANETTGCECTSILQSIQETDKNDCCNGVCELHEIFHFSAILSVIDIEFPNPIPAKLFFISSTPPTTIYQTTFKPPIA